MTAPITPGVVTGLSPFRVKLGTDEVAQPCQRVAPAQVGQSGGVLIWGGQRVWLGQYDAAEVDLSSIAARVTALESDTGWVLLTLAPGITAGGVAPAVRRIGQVVYGRGHVTLTAPTTSEWVQVASLPAGMGPSRYRRYSAGGYASTATFAAGTISVSSDGIQYGRSGGPAGAPVATAYLDLSWPID